VVLEPQGNKLEKFLQIYASNDSSGCIRSCEKKSMKKSKGDPLIFLWCKVAKSFVDFYYVQCTYWTVSRVRPSVLPCFRNITHKQLNGSGWNSVCIYLEPYIM